MSICVQLLQLWPTLCELIDYSHQAPLSVEFSRQEYWGGLSFSPAGDLPDLGIQLTSAFPELGGGFFFFFLTTSANWEVQNHERRPVKKTYRIRQAKTGYLNLSDAKCK